MSARSLRYDSTINIYTNAESRWLAEAFFKLAALDALVTHRLAVGVVVESRLP